MLQGTTTISPLSPHDMKTVKFDDMIAYQSEHSIFSNFYPCEVKVGKHIYTSVEQAYHHIRARHHRQFITALKILLKRKPREIKQLGEEIEEDAEWKKQKLEIMLKCMTMKFEQNPDLAEALKKTKATFSSRLPLISSGRQEPPYLQMYYVRNNGKEEMSKANYWKLLGTYSFKRMRKANQATHRMKKERETTDHRLIPHRKFIHW